MRHLDKTEQFEFIKVLRKHFRCILKKNFQITQFIYYCLQKYFVNFHKEYCPNSDFKRKVSFLACGSRFPTKI